MGMLEALGLSVGAILALLVGLTPVLIGVLQWISNNKKYVKKYFRVVWKKARKLQPKDLLRDRPYEEYYYRRPEDDRIAKAVKKGESVLIVGSPLGGKTRAAYEALKRAMWFRDVLVPRSEDIEREEFIFPKHYKFWRRKVIFIDDFHEFVDVTNFDHLIDETIQRDVPIIATCRTGFEMDKVEGKMAGKSIYLETLFRDNIVALCEISGEEAEEIVEEADINLEEVDFDGNVGSLFIPLKEMQNRFGSCNQEEKKVLRSLKDMHESGIYRGDFLFPEEWIKQVAAEKGVSKNPSEWESMFDRFKGLEFLELENDSVRPEEVYLEKVVTRRADINKLVLLSKMLNTFSDEPDALFRLGVRAYDLGLYILEKAEYMKLAIVAYSKSLDLVSREDTPEIYAMVQNNLGNAYRNLGEVEDTAGNCRRAIVAFEEALHIYTLDRFLIDYATIQNNLGTAYGVLAEAEYKGENCRRAIAAFKEALKVYNPYRSPIQYALTQSNLGNAYGTIAEVEDRADNCRRAIAAFEEALKIRTLNQFPREYAATQTNLGAVYRALAEAEDRAENCRRAIAAYEEALKVYLEIYSPDRFPTQYAIAQNNLGNAYHRLAGVEYKAENCRRAIAAHEEALKVHTLDRFPIQYANTENNLGSDYGTLAEVENKTENCRLALNSFNKALTVFMEQGVHEGVRMVKYNIERLRAFGGEE